MIKKLQRKFILITMVSLLLVMVLLVGAINGINLYQTEKKIDGTIQMLSDNRGKFPEFDKKQFPKEPKSGFQMTEETPFETRYFIVELDEDGTVEEIDTGHISQIAVSSEDAGNFAKAVMDSGKKSGYKGIYKYAVVEKSDGSMIIFMNCRSQIQTVKFFLLISCAVAFGTLLLMFLLVSVFSKKAIKPIIESMEKQKQFITDAGHEIKTPLAIISANADVLELTGGDNEWITSIRNQTTRLDKLVKNLLMLSKMEEGNLKIIFADFDLSKVITETSGTFVTMAKMQNKTFLMDIQPGIKLHGDENSIQQLISTLCDNAIKYSNEEGTLKVSLSAAKKGIRLEAYNTTEEIDKENLDKLFDRFYRADSSRSRETGGYGIGLSIARSIVEAHHGKITAKSEDGKSIRFIALL